MHLSYLIFFFFISHHIVGQRRIIRVVSKTHGYLDILMNFINDFFFLGFKWENYKLLDTLTVLITK